MRVEYNPMDIISPSEMLSLDLEFPYPTGDVEKLGIADFQGKRQLDCYTQYSQGITAKPILRMGRLPLTLRRCRRISMNECSRSMIFTVWMVATASHP